MASGSQAPCQPGGADFRACPGPAARHDLPGGSEFRPGKERRAMTAIEGPTSRRIAAPTRPGAGPARASGFRLDMPAPGEAHAAAAPLAAASLAGAS